MLYIFSGLPAVGKTSLARYLANELGACYLRIDSVEQSLRNGGFHNVYDEGYQICASIALDNLKIGTTVIADATNPVNESRQLWWQVAKNANCPYLDIEVICSDKQQHKRRVEYRETDIPSLTLPDWQSVITRQFKCWKSERIIIDTAGKTLKQSQQQLLAMLKKPG